MLDAVRGPQDVIAELQVFRHSLRQLVADVATEISLRNRMNSQKVEALCAQIEASMREYSGLLMRINADRVAHETAASDRDALIALRREWGVATSRSNLLRVELNQWSQMREMINVQVINRRKRLPLYEKQQNAIAQVQTAASDDMFDLIHAILNQNEQSSDAHNRGCFPDIALANSTFQKHMHAAYRVLLAMGRTEQMRFLDVGCGGGLKVLAALRYFKEADGFDYQQSYVDTALALLESADASDANAFQADALTFDRYSDYDVIYFFRPIQDDEKMVEMERWIVDNAAPGTLLVAPYAGFGVRHTQWGCGHVDGAVYMAKTSQNQADQWRRKAEQTGAAVVRAEKDRMPTIWTPLLRASRHSGYDIARFEALI